MSWQNQDVCHLVYSLWFYHVFDFKIEVKYCKTIMFGAKRLEHVEQITSLGLCFVEVETMEIKKVCLLDTAHSFTINSLPLLLQHAANHILY